MWIVPRMRKAGSLEYFAKYAWAYALCLSIPATYMGFFNVAMTYGSPGGQPEFNVFSAVSLYISGRSVGFAPGAVAGIIFILILNFIVVALKR